MSALKQVTLVALLATATSAAAQNWTRFRGPNGTGVSSAKGIPQQFTEKDYNWKVELPGQGHGQPVLWGSKIFVQSAPASGKTRLLSCHDAATGKELWKKEINSGSYHNHSRSSYASSTAACDAKRVYVTFQHPQSAFINAYDHSGEKVWTYDLGKFASQHGFGGSPMVYGDSVIFPVDQLGKGSESPNYVVALEAETGHVKWKTPIRSRRASYGTPCVHKGKGGRDELLFTSGANGIYSLDAKSGKKLWDANVFKMRTVSSPVVASGLVFGTCGSGGGGNYLVAVKPGGKGDVKDTHVQYTYRQAVPYVPTPVAYEGKLFLLNDKSGVLTCLKASTGEALWTGRTGGKYSGSPIIVNGKLYCINHKGEVVVFSTGDKFEELGRSPLGELCRSTPAVAGGKMYIRTLNHLISIGGK